MKMSEIKDLSKLELEKKFRDLGEELLTLQVRKQTGQIEKPHMINELKKDRARLATLLTQIRSEASAS
jgi:large subunit ribosomal protein L29